MSPDVFQRVDNDAAICSSASPAQPLKIESQGDSPVLVCFSHLRWNFVYQRPQHLMSRFARTHRLLYVEEPLTTRDEHPWMERHRTNGGVTVLVPRLPTGIAPEEAEVAQRMLLDMALRDDGLEPQVLWYYTPMSLAFSGHLNAGLVVYDCMDELSAFRGAPPQLTALEAELLSRADIVFTGGYSLYEAKRRRHGNAHPFPSSVDVAHFRSARSQDEEPEDQRHIAHPRLGFYGVLDERFDAALVARVAAMRPSWQLVFVGPIVKIDPVTLPCAHNIHYLGPKPYEELPCYLAGWDVALMPFAINESTRFISPTKTPEYLAAAKPVVSTPIADVMRTYSDCPMVRIAHGVHDFVSAVGAALADARDPRALAKQADRTLADMSWDRTWDEMSAIMRRSRREGMQAGEEDHTAEPAPAAQDQDEPCAPARIVPLDGGVGCIDGKGAWPPGSTPRQRYDYVVVGAGFAGSVLAERLAAGLGLRVLVVDRRPHIGGNAYDCFDSAGVLVHRYGPHIFHTNSEKVVEYLSRFTSWRSYEHRVLASVDGALVPMPINLTTLAMLYGRPFTPEQGAAFLAARAETPGQVLTAEDVVVSQVGRELYEKFFRGYTRKQWGLDPSALDRSVTARVPTRTSYDDRYFTDSFQAMPEHGYTRMFENMLAHPNIDVMLDTDFRDVRQQVKTDKIVYTGPIDEFFDHRYGRLPYRSLVFRHETRNQETLQPVAVVNYPAPDVPYTRITEYKHLTGQRHAKTSISYEYPAAEGDPYYPIPRPENAALFRRYQALADATPNVHFVGRLATYKYYNMDQVVAQALSVYARIEAQEAVSPSLTPRAALA